jgi:glutaminyl-peptide cyclotransferase
LQIWNDTLVLESGGLYGGSSLRLVDLATGKVLQQVNLDPVYFAEGLTVFFNKTDNDRLLLIQLTWREETALVYDLYNWSRVETWQFAPSSTRQGWGVAYREDKHVLYVTDGSQYIHLYNPDTLQEIGKVAVNYKWPAKTGPQSIGISSQGVVYLNELEWDHHSKTLLANVYLKDIIVRIDVETGQVLRVYDLAALYVYRTDEADVLNGIAVTDEPNVIWVTGKLWPTMYKIELIDG